MADVDVAYVESSENYGNQNSIYAPIPDCLDYNQPQGVGLVKRLKDAKFYPNGASSIQYGPGDTIRFNINTNDFWDPYSARIRLTVKVPDEIFAEPTTKWDGSIMAACKIANAKCVQLDSSALSYFSNFKYMDMGKDLERIDEADVINCGIKDMTYGKTVRTTKDHEGLGGQVGVNYTNQYFSRVQFLPENSSGADYTQSNNFQGEVVSKTSIRQSYTPTGQKGKGSDGSVAIRCRRSLFFDPTRSYNYTGRQNGINQNAKGDATAGSNTQGAWPDLIAQREFQLKPLPVMHLLYGCPNLGFETIYGDGFSENVNGVTYSVGDGISIPGQPAKNLCNNVYPSDSTDLDDDGGCIEKYGFSNPMPGNFGTTTLEPIYSKEPQRCVRAGVPSVQQILEYTFHVPLPSGIFGAYMQPNNYKMIPMVAFKGLVFELVLSPYAHFTSWSSQDQSNRRYVITGIEIDVQLAEFLDLNVIRATNDSILKGFTLCTQSYDFCTKIAISANNIPPEIQVNKGHDSLRNLYIINLDNAYLSNTMYRKQYRLSMNVTKLQVKVGTDYFPPQAIEGHAGYNYGKRNCYEFYLNLLRSFNKINTMDELAINPHNFAINWRELFVANMLGKVCTNLKPEILADDGKGTYAQGQATDPNRLLGSNTFQSYHAFTANGMQLGYFYENRVIGKAMFGIPLDFINYSNDILSGIRTIDARPISILWECDNTSSSGNLFGAQANPQMGFGYAGNVTAYVFAEYDLILTFNNGEVKSVGRN